MKYQSITVLCVEPVSILGTMTYYKGEMVANFGPPANPEAISIIMRMMAMDKIHFALACEYPPGSEKDFTALKLVSQESIDVLADASLEYPKAKELLDAVTKDYQALISTCPAPEALQ